MKLNSRTTDTTWTAETAEALRRHFVREAQKHGTADGTFRVNGDAARRAFAGWDYVRICEWAAAHQLTVDFLPLGALDLRVFG